MATRRTRATRAPSPDRIADRYAARLRVIVDELYKRALELVLEWYDGEAAAALEELEAEDRGDALDVRLDQRGGFGGRSLSDMSAVWSDVRVRWGGIIPHPRARQIADRFGGDIDAAQRAGHNLTMPVVLAVDPLQDEPWLDPVLDAWGTANANLITALPERAVADIERGVREAWRRGLSTADLRELLEERHGMTRRRADLIARDQTAKLNGQLSGIRQAARGVERYEWRTARDERVRQKHTDREGVIFEWEDPPPGGHPGYEFQCRCQARPVLEGLVDDRGVITREGLERLASPEHGETMRAMVDRTIRALGYNADAREIRAILKRVPTAAAFQKGITNNRGVRPSRSSAAVPRLLRPERENLEGVLPPDEPRPPRRRRAPAPPPPPPPPPVRTPEDIQRELFLDNAREIATISGWATPQDGPLIENFSVRWRAEDGYGGRQVYARFKLTAQGRIALERAIRERGGALVAQGQSWYPQKANLDFTANMINRSGTTGVAPSYQRFHHSTLLHELSEGSPAALEMTLVTEDSAFENWVEFMFETDDAGTAFDAFRWFGDRYGLEGWSLPPSEPDRRRMLQSKLIALFDPAGYATLRDAQNLRIPSYEEVEQLYQATRARAQPYGLDLDEVLADASEDWTMGGHVSWWSERLATWIRDTQGVRGLYHQSSSTGHLELLFSDPNGSGLVSTAQRWERGLFTSGMSSARDVETGGADSVFLRAFGSHTTDTYSGGGATFVIDWRQLGRLDWYGFTFDNYGRVSDYGDRIAPWDLRYAQKRTGHEIMLRHSVPTSAFRSVFVSDARERSTLISSLQARGITQVNGVDLEDFFVRRLDVTDLQTLPYD